MPGMFPALSDTQLTDLTPDSPAYYTYFCDVHTEAWFNELTDRAAAVEAANAQILVSNTVLGDEALSACLPEHQQQLAALINGLTTLLGSPESTSEQITLKTSRVENADRYAAGYLYSAGADADTNNHDADTDTNSHADSDTNTNSHTDAVNRFM